MSTEPNKRPNARPASFPRTPQISYPGLARVDGSARFSFGSTGPCALGSVSGPIEVRLAAENASHATLEVLVRPLANIPATEAKALAATVRGVLAPSLVLVNNPRTLVQVVVQVLGSGSGKEEERAGVMAAVVNAGTLALLNAGSVPMRGVVCAVAVGRRVADAGLVVDPEEGDGALDTEGCFAFMFTRDGAGEMQKKCVWTNWRAVSEGKASAGFDEGVLGAARNMAGHAAREVYEAVYRSVDGIGKTQDVLVLKVEDDDKMDI
ncbi:hypothetical protein D9615_004508 [Tricholomella constricta]|uniref:Exoribonuclease phosphorolytic domain-containing protein n=1 Tax=Tricholomella constricta TaxID=117010 RepID=A0A8H5HBR6_9AGAR|nr:hypothetical protein D9615_004508 [Tricholomella constricta]